MTEEEWRLYAINVENATIAAICQDIADGDYYEQQALWYFEAWLVWC